MHDAGKSKLEMLKDKASELSNGANDPAAWDQAKAALQNAEFLVQNPAPAPSGFDWQDLAKGQIPSAWMGCGYMPPGMRIGCCLQTVCGAVLSSGMMDPVASLNFTNTLSCTSTNMAPGSCFTNVTDPASVKLKDCLACNDCMARPAGLICTNT